FGERKCLDIGTISTKQPRSPWWTPGRFRLFCGCEGVGMRCGAFPRPRSHRVKYGMTHEISGTGALPPTPYRVSCVNEIKQGVCQITGRDKPAPLAPQHGCCPFCAAGQWVNRSFTPWYRYRNLWTIDGRSFDHLRIICCRQRIINLVDAGAYDLLDTTQYDKDTNACRDRFMANQLCAVASQEVVCKRN